MHTIKRVSLKNANIFFLSFAGLGFSPIAPGTVGSLATIPFLYLLSLLKLPLLLNISLVVLLTVIAIISTQKIQTKLQVHDPSWIVFDEVLGMLTTWPFFPTHQPINLLVMFILFRFFDIIKIWPASYFDKKMHHGAGTILDDIISGIYAGIVFLLLQNYFSFIS